MGNKSDLILQREFKVEYRITLCRLAIRSCWNHQGVTKKEVNENCFEIKNIGLIQGLGAEFFQNATILLTKITENSTMIQIQTSPCSSVTNESKWQSKMEKLISIMWTELSQSLKQCSVNDTVLYNVYDTNTPPNVPVKKNKTMLKTVIVLILIMTTIFALIIVPQISNFYDASIGIKVKDEELFTSVVDTSSGSYLYPVLVIKIKNVSSVIKNVTFEANFYADGNLLGSGQSSQIALEPGAVVYLPARSNKGVLVGREYLYSYKITKWSIISN